MFMTAQEVANRLGFKLRTVQNWCATQRIKSVKIANEWRIEEEEVEKIERGEIKI